MLPRLLPNSLVMVLVFSIMVLILHLLFGDEGEGEGGIGFFLSLVRLQELAGSLVSV